MTPIRRPLVLAASASFVLATTLGAAFAASTSVPIEAEAAAFTLITNSKDTHVQACQTAGAPNGIEEIQGKVWGPFTAEAPNETFTTNVLTDPRLNGTGLLEYSILAQPDGNGVMDGHLHIFRNAPPRGQEPSGPQTADGEVHATLVTDDGALASTAEFMDGFMLLHLEGQPAGSSSSAPPLPPGQLYANFTSNVNLPSNMTTGLQVYRGKLGHTGPMPGRDTGPSGGFSWASHPHNNAAMFIADNAKC